MTNYLIELAYFLIELAYLLIGGAIGWYGFDYSASRGWGFWKGFVFTLLLGLIGILVLTGVLYLAGFLVVVD